MRPRSLLIAAALLVAILAGGMGTAHVPLETGNLRIDGMYGLSNGSWQLLREGSLVRYNASWHQHTDLQPGYRSMFTPRPENRVLQWYVYDDVVHRSGGDWWVLANGTVYRFNNNLEQIKDRITFNHSANYFALGADGHWYVKADATIHVYTQDWRPVQKIDLLERNSPLYNSGDFFQLPDGRWVAIAQAERYGADAEFRILFYTPEWRRTAIQKMSPAAGDAERTQVFTDKQGRNRTIGFNEDYGGGENRFSLHLSDPDGWFDRIKAASITFQERYRAMEPSAIWHRNDTWYILDRKNATVHLLTEDWMYTEQQYSVRPEEPLTLAFDGEVWLVASTDRVRRYQQLSGDGSRVDAPLPDAAIAAIAVRQDTPYFIAADGSYTTQDGRSGSFDVSGTVLAAFHRNKSWTLIHQQEKQFNATVVRNGRQLASYDLGTARNRGSDILPPPFITGLIVMVLIPLGAGFAVLFLLGIAVYVTWRRRHAEDGAFDGNTASEEGEPVDG